MLGSVPAGATASELCVMSAVRVDVPNALIVLGEAEVRSTIQGLKSAPVPVTAPQPVLPGPALQPHQLFSRSRVRLFGLSIAVVVETMRLKCAVALAPLLNARPVPLAKRLLPVMVAEPAFTLLPTELSWIDCELSWMSAEAFAPVTEIPVVVLLIDVIAKISIATVSPVEPTASTDIPTVVPSILTPLTFAAELVPANPKLASLSTRDTPTAELATVPPVTVVVVGVVPRFQSAAPRSNCPPVAPTMFPFRLAVVPGRSEVR